jgi:hypothetical protein
VIAASNWRFRIELALPERFLPGVLEIGVISLTNAANITIFITYYLSLSEFFSDRCWANPL